LTYMVGGWSALVALHLIMSRPRWYITVWPIVFLVAVTCATGLPPAWTWLPRVHAVGMVGGLIIAGWIWPWTHYRALGGAVGAALVTLAAAERMGNAANAKAGLTVLAAFMLLVGGALLSWHKHRLLTATDAIRLRDE
jgi:hypothetical protein